MGGESSWHLNGWNKSLEGVVALAPQDTGEKTAPQTEGCPDVLQQVRG